MKNWKWLAFLLVGTSFCLCAPTAFAAESAGLHTQLPGAELWQPYLDQSPVDALQVAEDPWSVLQSFCTSSLFQTLRESIRGYAALLLFLLLSAIVSLFLGEEGDHSWCDLVCAGGCGILLWEPLLEIARQLCAQIESWNRFLSGFLPVYAGVLIMGGETSAGAAASGFFLTLLCLLAQALTAFVPPILECFLALSMACCITEQSCLGNLCKAAGTLLQKGLSLTGKLLAALLGFQRISAAQLDRTALRTGQFLTGTIPIVGQSLSDASEVVLAGIQLLKSGLGMAAILILLAEFLPLYLGMLAHLGCIVLCGTLCSLTGNNRGQALLTCFASAVRCMMACIALFRAGRNRNRTSFYAGRRLMQTLKSAAVVFCTACICAELLARLTENSWARRCIKAVAGLYILVVLLQVIPQLRTEVQSFSVPDLSPASMGTLEDAIRAELDARSSGQEAKEGDLSG